MSQATTGLPELLVGHPDWQAVLSRTLLNFQCVTGTIHRTDPSTGLLTLIAHQGIPPQVLPMLLPKSAVQPYPWRDGERETAASAGLLTLLERWVKEGL